MVESNTEVKRKKTDFFQWVFCAEEEKKAFFLPSQSAEVFVSLDSLVIVAHKKKHHIDHREKILKILKSEREREDCGLKRVRSSYELQNQGWYKFKIEKKKKYPRKYSRTELPRHICQQTLFGWPWDIFFLLMNFYESNTNRRLEKNINFKARNELIIAFWPSLKTNGFRDEVWQRLSYQLSA